MVHVIQFYWHVTKNILIIWNAFTTLNIPPFYCEQRSDYEQQIIGKWFARGY